MLSGLFVMNACNRGEKKSDNADYTTSTSDSATNTAEAMQAGDTTSAGANKFAMEAASGGMMEVQLGEVAQKNAQSSRVKGFGAMMIKDHSKANAELKTVAGKKNITLPTALMPEHQKHVDEMMKLSGAEFDQKYIDMMEKDHKEDVNKFEDASKNNPDPDLKAFAAKTLPVLQMHLDSVKAIQGSMKK
jgi:putative membrane protein